MTDAELIHAISEGHVGALRALHERHAPWLRIRLLRRSNDASLVDDAIQDVLIVIAFSWDTRVGWRLRSRRKESEGFTSTEMVDTSTFTSGQ